MKKILITTVILTFLLTAAGYRAEDVSGSEMTVYPGTEDTRDDILTQTADELNEIADLIGQAGASGKSTDAPVQAGTNRLMTNWVIMENDPQEMPEEKEAAYKAANGDADMRPVLYLGENKEEKKDMFLCFKDGKYYLSVLDEDNGIKVRELFLPLFYYNTMKYLGDAWKGYDGNERALDDSVAEKLDLPSTYVFDGEGNSFEISLADTLNPVLYLGFLITDKGDKTDAFLCLGEKEDVPRYMITMFNENDSTVRCTNDLFASLNQPND